MKGWGLCLGEFCPQHTHFSIVYIRTRGLALVTNTPVTFTPFVYTWYLKYIESYVTSLYVGHRPLYIWLDLLLFFSLT